MKTSVKSYRYLAALTLLALGVVLTGCGGFLGSLDGSVPEVTVSTGNVSVPIPAGATISQSANVVLGASQAITVGGLPSGGTATFSVVSGGNLITLTPSGNSANVQFKQVGTAVVRVLIQVPGEAARTLNLTFNIQHPQGHAQGGATGG